MHATDAHVLLAEDDPAIRLLMTEILSDEGFHVTGCASAREALQRLADTIPDLVIADMQMEHPVAGLELVRQLRSTPATAPIPVILYSAQAILLGTLAPQIRALNVMAVEKPFDVFALIDLAHALIAQRQRQMGEGPGPGGSAGDGGRSG